MKHSFDTLRYQFLGLLLPVFLIVSIAISFSSILSMNYKLENLYWTTTNSIVMTLRESLEEPLKKNDFHAAADILSKYENNNKIHGTELKNAALSVEFLINEFNPGQKTIIVSGFSETERVKAAPKLGAGAYVKKALFVRNK